MSTDYLLLILNLHTATTNTAATTDTIPTQLTLLLSPYHQLNQNHTRKVKKKINNFYNYSFSKVDLVQKKSIHIK